MTDSRLRGPAIVVWLIAAGLVITTAVGISLGACDDQDCMDRIEPLGWAVTVAWVGLAAALCRAALGLSRRARRFGIDLPPHPSRWVLGAALAAAGWLPASWSETIAAEVIGLLGFTLFAACVGAAVVAWARQMTRKLAADGRDA